jgi:hypothetical protein
MHRNSRVAVNVSLWLVMLGSSFFSWSIRLSAGEDGLF